MSKQIHRNGFEMATLGHVNHGLWRVPGNRRTEYEDLTYGTDLAKVLERGLFDAGTPSEVADRIEEFIDTTDADGVNLIQHLSPGTFVDFVDLVVPELQRRGRYRTQCAPGETLRKRLFGAGGARPLDDQPAAAFRSSGLVEAAPAVTA